MGDSEDQRRRRHRALFRKLMQSLDEDLGSASLYVPAAFGGTMQENRALNREIEQLYGDAVYNRSNGASSMAPAISFSNPTGYNLLAHATLPAMLEVSKRLDAAYKNLPLVEQKKYSQSESDTLLKQLDRALGAPNDQALIRFPAEGIDAKQVASAKRIIIKDYAEKTDVLRPDEVHLEYIPDNHYGRHMIEMNMDTLRAVQAYRSLDLQDTKTMLGATPRAQGEPPRNITEWRADWTDAQVSRKARFSNAPKQISTDDAAAFTVDGPSQTMLDRLRAMFAVSDWDTRQVRLAFPVGQLEAAETMRHVAQDIPALTHAAAAKGIVGDTPDFQVVNREGANYLECSLYDFHLMCRYCSTLTRDEIPRIPKGLLVMLSLQPDNVYVEIPQPHAGVSLPEEAHLASKAVITNAELMQKGGALQTLQQVAANAGVEPSDIWFQFKGENNTVLETNLRVWDKLASYRLIHDRTEIADAMSKAREYSGHAAHLAMSRITQRQLFSQTAQQSAPPEANATSGYEAWSPDGADAANMAVDSDGVVDRSLQGRWTQERAKRGQGGGEVQIGGATVTRVWPPKRDNPDDSGDGGEQS